MSIYTKVINFVLLIFCVLEVHAQELDDSRASSTVRTVDNRNIAIQATIFALPKDRAMVFMGRHHLNEDASTSLKDLQELVAENIATSDANFTFRVESGQHETIKQLGKSIELGVELVGSPDKTVVDADMVLTYGTSSKLNTTVFVRNGEARFLGAFDAVQPDQNVTYLTFVRLTFIR